MIPCTWLCCAASAVNLLNVVADYILSMSSACRRGAQRPFFGILTVGLIDDNPVLYQKCDSNWCDTVVLYILKYFYPW